MLIYESAEQQSEDGELCLPGFAARFIDCSKSSLTVDTTTPSTCDGA
jgi:hypothetical protein